MDATRLTVVLHSNECSTQQHAIGNFCKGALMAAPHGLRVTGHVFTTMGERPSSEYNMKMEGAMMMDLH